MFAATFFIIQLVMKYANTMVKTQFQFPKNALCIFYKQFGTKNTYSGRLRPLENLSLVDVDLENLIFRPY